MKEVEDYLASMSEDVSVVDIRVKEATTKKRDVGKRHGGSAQIEFESHDDASQALDTFQNLSNEIGDIPIGSIKSRWALNHTIDKSRKQHIEEKNEISEERILHRKMRAEKYARQRQAIAKRTDDLLEYINSSLQERLIRLIILIVLVLEQNQNKVYEKRNELRKTALDRFSREVCFLDRLFSHTLQILWRKSCTQIEPPALTTSGLTLHIRIHHGDGVALQKPSNRTFSVW